MYIIIIGEGMWERQKIESIKQNYCNNRIKKEYSCEVEVREENIVLTEKSKTHIIMGESKELSIKTYKNNLIKKVLSVRIQRNKRSSYELFYLLY